MSLAREPSNKPRRDANRESDPMAAFSPEQVVSLVLSIFCGVLGVFLLAHKGVRMMKGGLLYRISVGLAAISNRPLPERGIEAVRSGPIDRGRVPDRRPCRPLLHRLFRVAQRAQARRAGMMSHP